jgi:hypothetical protein
LADAQRESLLPTGESARLRRLFAFPRDPGGSVAGHGWIGFLETDPPAETPCDPFDRTGTGSRGSFIMMCLTKWLGAAMAIVLTVGSASAAMTVGAGKIKSIDADKKTFVLTDSSDKDNTYKFGEELVVNRDGKEGKSDLKAGDSISICYDKGVLTWTAHYILVQEGSQKNSELIRGKIKSYDATKKEMVFTNEFKKDWTYPMGKATVRVNMEEQKIETVTIGDSALLIINTVDGTSTLNCVMVDRK